MSDVTLTDFLLARIAEDEAAIGHWTRCPARGGGECSCTDALGRRNRKLLAECAAKRRIVAEHESSPARAVVQRWRRMENGTYVAEYEGFGCSTCHVDSETGDTYNMGWCDTLKALASVFADHPDYRAEWGAE